MKSILSAVVCVFLGLLGQTAGASEKPTHKNRTPSSTPGLVWCVQLETGLEFQVPEAQFFGAKVGQCSASVGTGPSGETHTTRVYTLVESLIDDKDRVCRYSRPAGFNQKDGYMSHAQTLDCVLAIK